MKIIIEPENGPAQVWSTEPAENRATLYENRAKDLEKQLEEEKDRADAWELRCGELEQENRELREAQEEARDRLHEQDVTIAKYDDENRTIKNTLYVAMDVPLHALNCWAQRIHGIAVDHGWWETEDGKCDDGDRPFVEIAMMCVTEIAEAVEEYRNGKPLVYGVSIWTEDGVIHREDVEEIDKWAAGAKPEGVAVEMIDCIIRILDWLGHEGIDVDTLMEKKVKYNEGREHRHGGKKA